MKKKVFAINILFFVLVVLIIALSKTGNDSKVDKYSDSAKIVLTSNVKVKREAFGNVVYAELKNRANEELNNVTFKVTLENSTSHVTRVVYINHGKIDAKEEFQISYEVSSSAVYDRCVSFQASIGSSTKVYFDVLDESDLKGEGIVLSNLMGYIIPVWFIIDIFVAMFFVLKAQKQKSKPNYASSYYPNSKDGGLKKVKCPFCGRKYYPTAGGDSCPSCGGTQDVY